MKKSIRSPRAPVTRGLSAGRVQSLSTRGEPVARCLGFFSTLFALLVFSSLLQAAELSATKRVAGSFQPGTQVTYTIVISNSGRTAQEDNRGDELTDEFSDDLAILAATSDFGNVKIEGQTAAWNGKIPVGRSVRIQITARIRDSVPAGRRISNQAVILFDRDGNRTNESRTLSDWPELPGDQDPTTFVVQAADSPPPEPDPPAPDPTPAAGADLKATIEIAEGFPSSTHLLIPYFEVGLTVCNEGDGFQANNPGPELIDVFSPALRVISATAESGSIGILDGDTVVWDGELNPSSCTKLEILAEPRPGNQAGDHTFYGRYAVEVDWRSPGHILNQTIVYFDGDGNGTNESFRLSDLSLAVLRNDRFLFPHVFSAGESGFTTISVTRLEEELELSAQFYDPAGDVFGDIIRYEYDGLDRTYDIPVPKEFVGSALVRCSQPCNVEGQWHFRVRGRESQVGLIAHWSFFHTLTVSPATSEDFPLPDTLPLYVAPVAGPGFALALRAARWQANCSVGYFDGEGERVAEETFSIPGLGQRAQFAPLPKDFKRGSAHIDCDAPVVVLALRQDLANGFPTISTVSAISKR